MTPLLRLTLVALCIVQCSNAAQAQTRYSLFPTTGKPADVSVSHPASFVGLNVAAWRDAELRLADRERVEITLTMPEGDILTLDVERFHVVDETTPLYELSVGATTQVPMPRAVLLRGGVRSSPSSHVMLAIFRTWATGYITLERAGVMKRYLLSPLAETPNSIHIVNEDRYAQHPTPWECSTLDTDFPATGKDKGQEQTQAVTKIIRVAIEGDEEYFIDHARDVYKCAEYAQAVLASVSAIYQRDVSAAVNTPWMGFWVSTDPYPGVTTENLLAQLRTYWLANRAGVNRAAVSLLSGVNGIGGLAYLDALCTNTAYAVSATNNTYTYPVAGYVFDTDIVAHEIGHNVGARHTHSCAWNPPIDSCVAAEGTCYTGTKAKLGTIMSYCHLTPFGTELVFHARVSDYMATRLAARSCVLAPGTMTVRAGPDTSICNGASVVLSGSVTGGTGPYTYAWTPLIGIANPNTLTPTVTPAKSITYVLEVRDNAGKINSDTVKVTVGPQLVVTVPNTLVACVGDLVSITATPSNGVGAYQYTWTYDGQTVRTNQPTLTFRPLVADTIMVVLVLNDSRATCQASDTAFVYVNRKPEATISGLMIACRGEIIMLTTSVNQGMPPYAWQWTVNNVPRSLDDNSVLIVVDDSLDIRYIVTDLYGCKDTARHFVAMRDYVATITPTEVQLPPIPPCADTASARVVFRNTGSLPITITQSNARVMNKALPVTIAPGASETFDVHLVNLPTGSFTDTLKFYEGICAKEFTTVLKGSRNGIRVTSQLPLVIGPFVACADSNTVDYTFNIANDAGVSVTLNLPEGPVVVQARSTTTIRRSIRATFTEPLVVDTLRVPYTSGNCSGMFIVPLRFISQTVTLIKPDSIVFGGVFNDASAPISKSFQLTSTTGGVPFVIIDSVDVSAPFSTALKNGQRLNSGVAITSSVTFTASQSMALGVVRDTLRVRSAGCDDVYEVPLSAIVVLTEVHSETLSGAISIAYHDDAIWIRSSDGSEFDSEVLDLRGRSVLRSTAQDHVTIDMRAFATGLYAVRVNTHQGRLVSRLILVTR